MSRSFITQITKNKSQLNKNIEDTQDKQLSKGESRKQKQQAKSGDQALYFVLCALCFVLSALYSPCSRVDQVEYMTSRQSSRFRSEAIVPQAYFYEIVFERCL